MSCYKLRPHRDFLNNRTQQDVLFREHAMLTNLLPLRIHHLRLPLSRFDHTRGLVYFV